jgi:hypothetical protein
MTGEEIQEIIDCPGSPSYAVSLCYSSKFPLVVVGSAPRIARVGAAPRVYAMPSLTVDEYIVRLEARES